MIHLRRFCALIGLLLFATAAICQEQQFAEIGDLKLQSGETLRSCRLGYRTYGKLNSDKSNVILFPTWAGGTTEQLSGNIGPGRLADTSLYYVVTVDALSNGVSSSPSNDTLQPRMSFPKITILDMVNAEHEFVTKVLHLQHVKAVMGISMGGMQTFQWIVAYPDFMDKAVPMVGSPRLAPYDLLLWQAQIDAIMNDPAWNHGDYKSNPARGADAEFGALLLTTPDHYNRTHDRKQVAEEIEKAKKGSGGFDSNNKIRQSQAMMALDVSDPFGGSMERAAQSVKAKTLVIVSKYDHTVTPQPARDFGKLLNAQVLELQGDCGHSATGCEVDKMRVAVSEFLAKN